MPHIKNIDAYIEHKVQKELDRTLAGMVERRLRQFNLNSISNRHQSHIINDFHQSTIKAGISQLMSFGESNSQFMNMFAGEIRRAVLRLG